MKCEKKITKIVTCKFSTLSYCSCLVQQTLMNAEPRATCVNINVSMSLGNSLVCAPRDTKWWEVEHVRVSLLFSYLLSFNQEKQGGSCRILYHRLSFFTIWALFFPLLIMRHAHLIKRIFSVNSLWNLKQSFFFLKINNFNKILVCLLYSLHNPYDIYPLIIHQKRFNY